MPRKKNFEDMTVDELSAYKLGKRQEIDAIWSDVREAHGVQDKKIHQEHIDEAVKQVTIAAEREGKTPEEMARYWLANQYADPGKHINARRFLHGRVVNADELEALAEADNV